MHPASSHAGEAYAAVCYDAYGGENSSGHSSRHIWNTERTRSAESAYRNSRISPWSQEHPSSCHGLLSTKILRHLRSFLCSRTSLRVRTGCRLSYAQTHPCRSHHHQEGFRLLTFWASMGADSAPSERGIGDYSDSVYAWAYGTLGTAHRTGAGSASHIPSRLAQPAPIPDASASPGLHRGSAS